MKWCVLSIRRITLQLALLSIGFFAYGQTNISTINTSTSSGTLTTYTATSPSDAGNDISANTSYTVRHGTGNNLVVSSYVVSSTTYDNFLSPDTLIIRRTDGGKFVNIWYTMSQINTTPNPDELDLDADQVSDADALYQSGYINAGYDNILVNEDDQASGSIQAQVERIDVIWYSGIFSCAPANSVFPIIERGGNDEIKIAAILGLDSNGDPSSYSSMVDIEDSDWPGSGISNDDYMVLRRQVVGQNPLPLINVGVIAGQSAQIVQGVAVSFSELGVGANDIIYGYSLFAFDVDDATHTLTDISTFPTNTTAANSGLDLVAGVSAAVSSDDCLGDASGPGGYKSALATWFKANEGVTTATDGSTVTDWQDAAIANNDATDYTGNGSSAPTYRSTSSTINFNPTIDFTVNTRGLEIADAAEINTDGSSEGSNSFESKGINLAFRTGAAVTNKQTIYSQGDDNRGINIYIRSGNIYVTAFNTPNDGSGAPWNSATVSTVSDAVVADTEYIVTLELNGNSSTSGTVTAYLNGQSMGSFGSVGLLYNHSSNGIIGFDDSNSQFDDGTQTGTGSFEGELSELIYCNEPGSSFPLAQRNRIESYLALKYGITLDQSTAINYVNSAGDVIFNTTNAASIGGYLEYNDDIAGIGRDDDSEFEQQKSKSENSGSIVTIDKGGSIGVDDTWLIWGNDQGALTETAADTPDTVDLRLTRIWRVAEEGDMGNVSVSFDVTGLGLSSSASDYSLLVAGNSSNGDFSNATVITGATINSNVVTFTNVPFTDGQYFTLGTNFFICSPGGVETDLALWLKADAGTNTSVDAADVTSWADQSVNNNDASEENGGLTPEEPTYRTNVVNYNPTIRFTDPGTNAFSYLRAGSNPATDDMTLISVFATTQSAGTSNFWESPQLIGGDEGTVDGATASLGLSSGNLFGKIKADDDINNSVVSSSTYTDGAFRIGSVTRVRGASGALELFVNSESVDTGTSDNNQMNLSTGVGIGNSDAAYIDAQFAGDIPEAIVFADDLDSDELNRVESYLAVKYGITRNASDDVGTGSIDERDYRRADGTAIWDYSVRTSTYYNDIAGIGRDDQSCFSQKQSKSENSDAIVAMGLGTIATDNAANSNTFASDGNFLVWGNDNAAREQASANTLDVPSGVTERMTRIWNVQETGTVAATTLQFDLTGLGYSNVLSDFQLITSATSTMASGTLTQAASLVDNILTFNNVDFTNGQFFTIGTARDACGPGNVTSGLNIWLEADGGTSTTTDNTTLTTWTDQSGNSNDGASDGNPPLFKNNSTDNINSNPSIDFDGTNDRLTLDLSDIKSGGSGSGDYAIFLVGERQSGDWSFVLGSSGSVVDESFGFGYNDNNTVATLAHYTNQLTIGGNDQFDSPAETPFILFGQYDGSGRVIEQTRNADFNRNTDSNTTDVSGSQSGFIGDFPDIRNYDGLVNEIVVYDTDITAIEKLRIYSYLALKWGVTLTNDSDGDATTNEVISGSVNEGDYVASDGTTIVWDYADQGATYFNDIAGIGRDDNSCWTQKQSRSENTDDIVQIGLGSIAASNGANVNSFDTDKDFLVWGNDNGATDQDNANTSDLPGIVSERMTRVWRVQETGTVGEVEVAFDLTGLTGAGDYSTTASDYLLIISSTSTMADGTTYGGGTFDGSVLSFTGVNFSDGDYFTLGTAQSNCGPGGVTTNINFWYKADAGTNTTTDGADVTSWSDQGTGSNNGTEVDQGGFTPVEPTYETSEVNFNPVLRFTDANSNNNSYIQTSSNSVSGDFTLISVFQSGTNQGTQDDFVNTPALIGADDTADGLDYGLVLENGQVALNASDGVTFDAETSSTYTDNNPHIAVATRVQSSGAVEIFIDGESEATGTGSTSALSTPSSFGIGNHNDADVQAQYSGDIAETLVYSATLTDLEIARVSSYLALKYGITLSNNQDGDGSTNEVISGSVNEGDYVAADGAVIWDYADQGSTYFNDIFGIGRDDLSCLNQTKSKSENSDALVTFELSGGFSTDDAFLISGNDNAVLEDKTNEEFDQAQVRSRFNREWRVQETGTVGSISLTYDLSSVNGPTGIGTNNLNLVRLMVDSDGDFSSGATLISPTSVDGSSNTVTFSVDFTNGDYYTLGSIELAALPITLISFNASAIDQQVEVSWSTAQEINNAFYTVERGRDPKNFETIGFVEGAGTSNQILDYTFYDTEPLDGISYYRLKQTDFNGQSEYSEVRKVIMNVNGFNAHKVFPNPVLQGQDFRVVYPVAEPQDIGVQVYNSSGKTMTDRIIAIKPEEGEFVISTTGMSPGLHFIRIISPYNDKITLKFIIK